MSVARVREVLAEQRQAGLDFASAWPTALDALEPDERREWLEVLEATANAWGAAYRGEPATRAQYALHAVGEDPDRDVPTGHADPWQRVCATCSGPIPESKRATARYCGLVCRRSAHGRRVAA